MTRPEDCPTLIGCWAIFLTVLPSGKKRLRAFRTTCLITGSRSSYLVNEDPSLAGSGPVRIWAELLVPVITYWRGAEAAGGLTGGARARWPGAPGGRGGVAA